MLLHQIHGLPRFTIPATSGWPLLASIPSPMFSK